MSNVTENVTGFGSNYLQAPELLRPTEDDTVGVARLSSPSDIYALGMTILETVTGRLPFDESKNDLALMVKITRGDLPNRPNEFSAETRFGDARWALLTNCWSMEPMDRPLVDQVFGQV
ncbi:WD repeat-containing protein [Ceratobasidium sp. AG-Ba]|nr:WD repeat-containing protein [Ceratobasidium sp. AG-Ba]